MVNALVTQVLEFLVCSGSALRPKAACAAIVKCTGYASLGFLLCSGSVYDQRLPALRLCVPWSRKSGISSLGFLVCSGSVYDQRLPALRLVIALVTQV